MTRQELSYRKHHVKSKIKKLKPKKSVLKNKWFWLIILTIAVFGVIIRLLFFASFLQVDNILISGNKEIKTEDIKIIVEKNANRNIFLVNMANIQKDILNTFPEIKLAKVQKNYFKTLSIKVEERIPVAIFCATESSASCNFVDEGGMIFKSADFEFVGLANQYADKFVTVRNSTIPVDLVLGKQVLDKNIIDAILKTQKTLKDNYGVDVKEVLIQNQSRLNIKTSENWQIYFDIDSDLNVQVTKLDLLLKGEISENIRKNLQYIDLRFKDRAYYK